MNPRFVQKLKAENAKLRAALEEALHTLLVIGLDDVELHAGYISPDIRLARAAAKKIRKVLGIQ